MMNYIRVKKKEPIEPIIVYNEIHDDISYSEEEIKIIIEQAQILRNKQNQ